MTFLEKLKQKMWRGIYRFFPAMQKGFLKWGIVWHEKERQKYHLGWLAPGKTLEELKKYLHEKWGFGNHFVAWTDTGQVLSWRKLESFSRQYHLRVFEEGEIRGHYEFTPEEHPMDHFMEKGESEHREDFIKFLGDFMVQEKCISCLVMDPDAYNPDSEITIDDKNKLNTK